MSLTAGTRLGPYEVVAPLGGGMGEVYRARDSRLGREVAIKVLPESFAADPDRVARFEREARTLASLNHPHVSTIHGIEETDGRRALVMELVEGPTLADLLGQPGRSGSPAWPGLPLDDALGNVALQPRVCRPVDFAHPARADFGGDLVRPEPGTKHGEPRQVAAIIGDVVARAARTRLLQDLERPRCAAVTSPTRRRRSVTAPGRAAPIRA
jgi:hypothetical protein